MHDFVGCMNFSFAFMESIYFDFFFTFPNHFFDLISY